jgi:CheY-like chemotaxis protein
MPKPGTPITILLADDDPDDRLMCMEALAESRLANELRTVGDGEELLEYLRRTGRYAPGPTSPPVPRPGLILLDLNLPRKDGREVLADIKSDPDLCDIPIVVLTTSAADEDILRSYQLHANAYVTKPVDFNSFVEVVRQIDHFFVTVVSLPPRQS